MKTYRNLTYALLVLTAISLGVVVTLSVEGLGRLPMALYNLSVSVASVAIVVLIVSLFMFFHSRNLEIVVLKRRGSRVYDEMLQHKMKLIEIMDGERPLSEWENFLYHQDEFPRIKKFLYEEYFVLLSYEPFFHSRASDSVAAFHSLHKELENFMRSVMYDRIEYNKFRSQFHKEMGHDIGPDTTEADFTSPMLEEAYEAILSANEYALQNVDNILKLVNGLMKGLDPHFRTGIPWSVTKAGFDSEFRMWMSSKD